MYNQYHFMMKRSRCDHAASDGVLPQEKSENR